MFRSNLKPIWTFWAQIWYISVLSMSLRMLESIKQKYFFLLLLLAIQAVPPDNPEDEETPEVDKDYAANAIFLKKLMSLDDGTRQRIGHW